METHNWYEYIDMHDIMFIRLGVQVRVHRQWNRATSQADHYYGRISAAVRMRWRSSNRCSGTLSSVRLRSKKFHSTSIVAR
ncbi:hypothetical protein HAX54_050549, partial [Datura stramonium]|nr:hypothetical protein [Datura stramonium]